MGGNAPGDVNVIHRVPCQGSNACQIWANPIRRRARRARLTVPDSSGPPEVKLSPLWVRSEVVTRRNRKKDADDSWEYCQNWGNGVGPAIRAYPAYPAELAESHILAEYLAP